MAPKQTGVLLLGGDELAHIAGLLSVQDRVSLSGTCRALRAASKRSWFAVVTVVVSEGEGAELAAWLQERQAKVHVVLDGNATAADLRALRNAHVASIRGEWLNEGEDEAEDNAGTLGSHYKIEALELAYTDRSTDWAGLGRLQQLSHLGLTECSLGALPRQLSALTSLTTLVLRSNQFRSGWQHLQTLCLLNELDLSSGRLAQVPAPLSHLTALSLLDLSLNRIRGGWKHLFPLTALRSLQLAACGLVREVPEVLSRLTSLTRLALCYNLTLDDGEGGDWDHLQTLTNLQVLDISGNGLFFLPTAVSSLAALTALDLHGNCFNWQWPPNAANSLGSLSSLQPLVRLRRVDLSCVYRLHNEEEGEEDADEVGAGNPCEIEALPGDLSYLTAVTWLALNKTAAASWDVLRTLPQLQALHMRECRLRRWPAAVSCLTALTELDASSNQLGTPHTPSEAQWEGVCTLSALQRLGVAGNRLGQVPGALSQLTALTHLDLSESPLLAHIWLDLSPEQAAEAVRLHYFLPNTIRTCAAASAAD